MTAVVGAIAAVLIAAGAAHAAPAITASSSSRTAPVRVATLTASLTIDQRIAALRAIEEVYWRHRIWPADNPGSKPGLDAVLSDTAIRVRVEDDLRKSRALEALWGRILDASVLHAEMERMARESRDPGRLREIFDALGNDSRTIAECFVRPRLADRLLRNAYARDDGVHGRLQERAENEIVRGTILHGGGTGEHSEIEYVRSAPGDRNSGEAIEDQLPHRRRGARSTEHVQASEWAALAERISTEADGRTLIEDDDAFRVSMIAAATPDSIVVRTVSWPKVPFDEWWTGARGAMSLELPPDAGDYPAIAVTAAACADDTWSGMRIPAASARWEHRAVWTGSEMIIWGGNDNPAYVGTPLGGRYDPATDTWRPLRLDSNAPAGRVDFTMIWTGTEAIVWGGTTGGSGPQSRYNPTTDTWTPINQGGYVPPGFELHSAIWTGSEMIVWGGLGSCAGGVCAEGGRYNPATDTWVPTSVATAVTGTRAGHTAVWTGTRMIIWGGYTGPPTTFLNSGAVYDPVSNTWTALPTAGAPIPRQQHTAIWTGSEMVVWGGENVSGLELKSGARYKLSTNTWAATRDTGIHVPAARTKHVAIWDGAQMDVLGGAVAGGARYNPSTNIWTPLPTTNMPTSGGAGIWTGSELIVWGGSKGGSSSPGTRTNYGARWNPQTNAGLLRASRTACRVLRAPFARSGRVRRSSSPASEQAATTLRRTPGRRCPRSTLRRGATATRRSGPVLRRSCGAVRPQRIPARDTTRRRTLGRPRASGQAFRSRATTTPPCGPGRK